MIQALIQVLGPILSNTLDRFFPDKEKAEQAKREIEAALIENAAEINRMQLEVNKTEAGHRTVFVAGWRPFVGWTCGTALAWHYVGQPIAVFALTYAGIEAPPLPTFDMSTLLTVLMGMLGLGGLRTFEKLKGVTK